MYSSSHVFPVQSVSPGMLYMCRYSFPHFSCSEPHLGVLSVFFVCSVGGVSICQGGGLGLNEAAPSSIASPANHLDFLRLFCRQMRQRREEGEVEPQRDAKVSAT